MGTWDTLMPMIAGHVVNALGNKAVQWGNKLALQPVVVKANEPTAKPAVQEKPGTTYTPINPNQQAALMMGVDDGNWTRREQRRFRKGMGMSKLEFRNWKAELMGLNPNKDYSRKDIRALERSHNITSDVPLANIYSKQYLNRAADAWEQTHRIVPIQELPEPEEEVIEEEPLPGQAPSYFKTPGEMYLEYTQERFGLQPLPYMLAPNLNQEVAPPQMDTSLKNILQMHQDYVLGRFGLQPLPYMQLPYQPITPETPLIPITYNFGNNMNKYWSNQAQKVLGNLTPEELYKISGNDGEISYDDAIAWQQGIGAGNDGKFGSGTIGAMNTKYGLNAMADYKNPILRSDQKAKTLGEQIVINSAPSEGKNIISKTGDMLGNLIMYLR